MFTIENKFDIQARNIMSTSLKLVVRGQEITH
jgi:hypothetical protein